VYSGLENNTVYSTETRQVLDKSQTSLVLPLTLISFNSLDSDPIPLAYIQLNLSKCAPWYVWKPRGLRRGN